MYKVAIITLSDRAFNNVYEDLSGKYLSEYFNNGDYEIFDYQIIDDNATKLNDLLNKYINTCDLIITTGGTGLTTSDITVDVIEKIMDYEVRGMSVALHQFNLSKSLSAMFSRALCCVKGNSLIITMPGSLKAVKEISEFFLPYLDHGIKHLKDIKIH